MHEFMAYLKKEKRAGTIDPVIYTSGVPEYTQLMLDQIDPNREVFENLYHQNACVLLEKEDEDLYLYIKDIQRTGRPAEKSLLIDPKPISFLITPDNGIPC